MSGATRTIVPARSRHRIVFLLFEPEDRPYAHRVRVYAQDANPLFRAKRSRRLRFQVGDPFAEYERLQQSCIDEGPLTRAFGNGNLRITRKGQQFVKIAAITDEEVAAAIQEAVSTRWRDRRRRWSTSFFSRAIGFRRVKPRPERARRFAANARTDFL